MTATYTLDWEGFELLVSSGGATSRIWPTSCSLGTSQADGTIQWYVTGTTGYFTLAENTNLWRFYPTTFYSGGTFGVGEMSLGMDAVTGMPAIFLGDAGGYGYMFQHHYPYGDTVALDFSSCAIFPPMHLWIYDAYVGGYPIHMYDRNSGNYPDPSQQNLPWSIDWQMTEGTRPSPPVAAFSAYNTVNGRRYLFPADGGPYAGAAHDPGYFEHAGSVINLWGYGNQYYSISADHSH